MSSFVNQLFKGLMGYHQELDTIIKSFDTLDEGLDQYYEQLRDFQRSLGPHKANIADTMIRTRGNERPPQAKEWGKALKGHLPLLDLLDKQVKVIPEGLFRILETAEDALGRVETFHGLIPNLQREGKEDDVEDARAMLGPEFKRRQDKIKEREAQIGNRLVTLKKDIGEVRSEIKGLIEWLKL
ncbi:hypothetical protein TWF281_008672 [Arthrobotrys megalospora]